MNIEKMEILLEKIRVFTQDPTLTAEDRLDRVIELINEYKKPESEVTAKKINPDVLICYLDAIQLRASRGNGWMN